MTDQIIEPAHEDSLRYASPTFRQWLTPALGGRSKLWRTVFGAIGVLIIWGAWTGLAILAGILSGYVTRDGMRSLMGEGGVEQSYDDAVKLGLVLLATFAGLWLGVIVVVKAWHWRRVTGVISFNGRVDWRQFGAGAAIAAGYLLVGFVTSVATGHPPFRTNVELLPWLATLAPMCVLLLIQTTGEELFFRGYLVQQLAARFRHPLVWALIPAVAFGFGHYANGGNDVAYSVYYVIATIMFGLISTVCLWRTGSLSASFGLHFANNVAAFLIAGPEGGPGPGTTLWAWTGTDVTSGAVWDLITLFALLAFVASPWAPLPKVQLAGRKNDTRAAP
ncbi:MAG TPA: CPBP family intramembrane glutamic endopeptidase [Hyphomonadaceae bacterium]|nr:CPBP family intramembrane glutamic endopeptidase [Hyphomonadaceae bacterium]